MKPSPIMSVNNLLSLSSLFLMTTILIPGTSCVDKTKFKSCEQSSFCKRNRDHQAHEQQWALDMSTLKQHKFDVTGQLVDKNDPSLSLKVVLSLTRKGALRMKIDQIHSARRRFEAQDALNPSLTFQQLTLDEIDNERCVFSFGPSKDSDNKSGSDSAVARYRMILKSFPFQAEVLDMNDESVVLINSKGLMRFEDYKELTENQPGGQQLFGTPKTAQAYDEAGRPIEDAATLHDQHKHSEQASTDGSNDKIKSYAEIFSTFTDQRPYGPMSVGADIYFPNSDHIFGIPEHADSFSLRDTRPNIGDPYRLYNVDIFEYELNSPMSLYGAIPFMIAQSKTTGTFGISWLNPSDTWIDIESNHSQTRAAGVVDIISSFVSKDKKMSGRLTHWFSETGLIDIWFMPGPSAHLVMSYNAEIFGTPPIPPVYSTGFHQCRWNYYSEEEVMQVERGYDEAEIPLDAIWLDIEYTYGRSKKYFTWDPLAFANHVELASNLSSKGRRLIAIIDPHIKKEDGYDIYDEANAMDFWVRDSTGQSSFEGWCWPGASKWPDYLSPQVRDWWGSKFNPAYFPGESHSLVDIWNDMNEPSVFSGPEVTAPRDLKHVDGWEHRDVHNMYGFLMTKATYEGMYKYRKDLGRPFILTRSLFAGSQRYCAAWTGDNQARWDHLKITVPMLLSLSVSGMPFVGADVGGFFNNPESDELLVRWHQAGAFQPFFRAHAHHDARHREAYLFQGQTLDLLRSAINLRYSYLPYWYTLFFEAHMNGMPMMRPHWFHDAHDGKYDIEDQYLVGYALLVKPVLDKGISTMDVYLPGTDTHSGWFDLNNHVMYKSGQTVHISVNLATVPLFQRTGTIIPRQYRMRRSAELLVKEPVTLDIVLGLKQGKTYAHGSLYADDYKKLEPDVESATLKDIIFFNDHLYIKPSTNATISHSLIERVVIYNWPVSRHIRSITVKPENSKSDINQKLDFKLANTRADGTAFLEIRKPQLRRDWKVWTLRIDIAV